MRKAFIGAAAATLLFIGVIGPSAAGQSTIAPAFDLADVRLSPRSVSTATRGPTFRGGRYEGRRVTLPTLIRDAYGVPVEKIVGGPNWLDFERFDITAATALAANREMLQSLLAERFKLTQHMDNLPQPQYALHADKTKLRLKPSAGSGPSTCRTSPIPQTVAQQFSCQNITMAAFAPRIQGIGRYVFDPVVDATGLSGSWDFEFTVTPASAQAAADDGDTIFNALGKLGLELRREDTPVPVLVVDRVNRQPTDNLPGVAQKLAAAPGTFDVASIKPVQPEVAGRGGRGGTQIQPSGLFNMRGTTLRAMIAFAWDTSNDAIVGSQKILDDPRYDVSATVAADVARPVDQESIRPMLRVLLQERFKVAAHEGEEPLDVYALVPPRDIKMKRGNDAERGGCKSTPDRIPANTNISAAVTCTNTTMPQFASVLQGWAPNYIDHQVVDASGVDGAWNFTFMWTGLAQVNGRVNAGQAGDRADALAPVGSLTVFESIERNLGVTLKLQKRPMLVLVVDRAEPPTEN